MAVEGDGFTRRFVLRGDCSLENDRPIEATSLRGRLVAVERDGDFDRHAFHGGAWTRRLRRLHARSEQALLRARSADPAEALHRTSGRSDRLRRPDRGTVTGPPSGLWLQGRGPPPAANRPGRWRCRRRGPGGRRPAPRCSCWHPRDRPASPARSAVRASRAASRDAASAWSARSIASNASRTSDWACRSPASRLARDSASSALRSSGEAAAQAAVVDRQGQHQLELASRSPAAARWADAERTADRPASGTARTGPRCRPRLLRRGRPLPQHLDVRAPRLRRRQRARQRRHGPEVDLIDRIDGRRSRQQHAQRLAGAGQGDVRLIRPARRRPPGPAAPAPRRCCGRSRRRTGCARRCNGPWRSPARSRRRRSAGAAATTVR